MSNIIDIEVKRLLMLNRIILTLSVVTLIVFLNTLDLKKEKASIEYISLLKSIAKQGEYNLAFQQFEIERLRLLKNIDTSLFTKHNNVRIRLTEMLNRHGLKIDSTGKGAGTNANSFILMVNDILTGQLDSNAHSNSLIQLYENRTLTISESITLLNRLSSPENAKIVTEIDTGLLSKILNKTTDRKTIKDPKNIISNIFVFYSAGYLFLKFNVFIPNPVQYSDSLSNSQPVEQQMDGITKNISIKIPAKTSNVKFPPRLYVLNFNPETINKLSNNRSIQQELKNRYGNKDITLIEYSLNESLKNNEDSISILGFDISRWWYPFALFCILSFVYTLLNTSLKRIKKENFKIINNMNSEDVLDCFILNKYLRFFLWVLTPLLLSMMLLYSTTFLYSQPNYFLLSFIVLFCTYNGLRSFKISLAL